MPLETLDQRYDNAAAIDLEREDGSLYLATVCSMLELSTMARNPEKYNPVLIADAKVMQASLARHGKQIRIT